MGPLDSISLKLAILEDAEIYIFSIAFVFAGIVALVAYLLIRKQLKQFLAFAILSAASGLNLIRMASTFEYLAGSFTIVEGVHISTVALYFLPTGIHAFAESF